MTYKKVENDRSFIVKKQKEKQKAFFDIELCFKRFRNGIKLRKNTETDK
jgi:hypothetical protein